MIPALAPKSQAAARHVKMQHQPLLVQVVEAWVEVVQGMDGIKGRMEPLAVRHVLAEAVEPVVVAVELVMCVPVILARYSAARLFNASHRGRVTPSVWKLSQWITSPSVGARLVMPLQLRLASQTPRQTTPAGGPSIQYIVLVYHLVAYTQTKTIMVPVYHLVFSQ
jgi:hypothetical protein